MIRDRTGHKSDALFRYHHPTEKQLQKASSALGPVNSTSYESSPSDYTGQHKIYCLRFF